jgi:predicted enzyme related to lactoylglutathione lyase
VRVTHVFCGIPTADFGSAASWYERLLGRPPDNLPKEDEAVWQLADGGLIYLVSDAQRAGNGLLTLIVNDLDAEIAELKRRGIEIGAIETMPGAARKVTVTDPDGNSVTMGQPLIPS